MKPTARKSGTERGDKLIARFVGATVRELQAMTDAAMLLSGDDSGLENVWDEICVQQQTEESYSCGAYVETIRALLQGRVEELSMPELAAIWLRTEQGEDWSLDNDDGVEPAPVVEDVVEFLFTELISRANDHTNARIRAFIDRRWTD